MNQFIEFLKEYWFQLATAAFAVVEIILIIVKRKPKSIDDFKLALSDGLNKVADLVSSVEIPGNGEQKRNLVIKAIICFVAAKLGRGLTDSEKSLVSKCASDQIEAVLEAPQKKEIVNEK